MRMRNIACIVACFFSSLSLAESPLTLEMVLGSVREKFPQIRAQIFNKVAAEGSFISSQGAFDLRWRNRAEVVDDGLYSNRRLDSVLEKPTNIGGMNLYAGFRRGVGSFAPYDGKFFTAPGGEIRAGVEIPLWRDRVLDQRRGNMDRARIDVELAETDVDLQLIEAMRTAAQRYWIWVASGKTLRLMESLFEQAEVRDRGLRERVRQGDLPQFERIDNQRLVLQRRNQVLGAERSLQQAAIDLSLYNRDDKGETVLPTPAQLPERFEAEWVITRSEQELVKVALENRPEYQRIALQVRQNQIDNILAENLLAPRVDINFQTSRDIAPVTPELGRLGVESAIVVEIPLERNLGLGRLQSTKAIHERLRIQEDFIKDQIVADVRDILSLLQVAASRLNLARGEVELAKQLEQGEREIFRLGQSNILTVNLREQATADAAIREIEAIADYQIASTQLKAVIGER
jgi:outer membrane protein, heavy metal efflux system